MHCATKHFITHLGSLAISKNSLNNNSNHFDDVVFVANANSTNVLLMATAVCKINSAPLKMYVNCVQIKCTYYIFDTISQNR